MVGWVAGNNVSHVKGNMVDLESDLRNQTRFTSKCQSRVFLPSDDGLVHNDKTKPINIDPLHLKSCQTIPYQAVPLPYSNYISLNRCNMKNI